MAKLLLKSQRQIQSDILVQLLAELGLNDANSGSVIDVFTNAIAQEDFAQYVQMAQIARLVDLDAITGSDLDNKAFEYGIARLTAQKATGKISILRAATFVKVSTSFYAGSPAPIIGSTFIDVNDASNVLIGTTGTLILGRGTTNEEEISYSVSPTNNLNYYTFTLDTPLTKNHAVEETVILKQGNDEPISAGTQVKVQSTGVSNEIIFTLNNDEVLLSGESELLNVEVTAVNPGSGGNIAVLSIEGEAAFDTAPFLGARAENPNRFSTGRDLESDDELRDRIRSSVQSLSRGVKEAILNAIVGLVDPETAKRVISANIILPQEERGDVQIYIDDGTGFEPDFLSLGYEVILERANGGETRLQLDIQPLVKAQVETNTSEPFNMTGTGKTLIYTIGTQSETVTFTDSDFAFPDAATAEEIVTAINDKSTLMEARTSQTGTKVVVQAKAEVNEDIQITGGTANPILNFPTDARSTLYLYINDILKSKDGATAFIDAGNQGNLNLLAIGAFPHTLTIVVDKKTANVQTVTFNSSDFVDTSACTPAELIAVINAQIAGLTAQLTDNNTRVRLVSNTKLSTSSAVKINGGSANNVTNGFNFSTTQVVGIDGDYTLNRETGSIELKVPLAANDSVTSGSLFTRAALRAAIPENYAPNVGETLKFIIDRGVTQTVTFDASFAGGISAQLTADYINRFLLGGTALVREIGGLNYLEVRTNTYDQTLGFIEIDNTSTGNAPFGFATDTEASNQRPHAAFQVSQNSDPFIFRENDSLVVIVDDDIVNNTYSVIMDFDGELTMVIDAGNFRIGSFPIVFDEDDILNDFYIAFTEGPTTVIGDGLNLTDQGSDVWRIAFSAPPTGLAAIAVGDLVKITGFTENSNNGFFIITTVNTTGNGYIQFTNENGVEELLASAEVTMSQKRKIVNYVAATGQIETDTDFANLPLVGNNAIVLPSTVKNVVDYLNNYRITSLSLKAYIESVEDGSKVQISSRQNGSNGYIQIAGGKANEILDFDIDAIRGLQGYNYYTGLLKLVHKTIYGDDMDLVSFPGYGAAGILFRVKAPTVREVPVNVDVFLKEGISIASLENEIKSVISEYIQGLRVGQNLIIEEIRSRVIQVSGVIDVVLNDPLANIVIAQNEKATTRNSLIIVG